MKEQQYFAFLLTQPSSLWPGITSNFRQRLVNRMNQSASDELRARFLEPDERRLFERVLSDLCSSLCENTHTKAGESSYLFSWIPDLQRNTAVFNYELQSSKSQNLDLFSQ